MDRHSVLFFCEVDVANSDHLAIIEDDVADFMKSTYGGNFAEIVVVDDDGRGFDWTQVEPTDEVPDGWARDEAYV
jgi:hypothetical protein